MNKTIEMRDIIIDTIKLKNSYYDTDSVFKNANIHGGYTVKKQDLNKKIAADKAIMNRLFGRTADIKITVKKSELEYCFKAENYAEFERRFNDLKDIMHQRFINALTKRDIMHISGYIINQNRGDTK